LSKYHEQEPVLRRDDQGKGLGFSGSRAEGSTTDDSNARSDNMKLPAVRVSAYGCECCQLFQPCRELQGHERTRTGRISGCRIYGRRGATQSCASWAHGCRNGSVTRVFIENTPGWRGTIYRSRRRQLHRPDGTRLLLFGSSTRSTQRGLYAKLPFDPTADITPVAGSSPGPVVLSNPSATC